MPFASCFRAKSLLVWSISAFACIFTPQSPTAAQQTGSILGWGRQVVGVDLHGGFVAVAAGETHRLGLKEDGSIVAGGYNSLALKNDCLYILAGDLNNDCNVGFPDFSSMAANWFIDCHTDPNNPACIPK
jgi:hypothetical protein